MEENTQTKPTNMLTPSVIVDNFEVKTDSITAYCLVDEKDIDFSFTKFEFEIWCDENELRDYEMNIPSCEDGVERDVMCRYEWADLYDDHTYMYKLLKQYIEHLYLMDAMDIETPIKKILEMNLEVKYLFCEDAVCIYQYYWPMTNSVGYFNMKYDTDGNDTYRICIWKINPKP